MISGLALLLFKLSNGFTHLWSEYAQPFRELANVLSDLFSFEIFSLDPVKTKD